MRAAYSAPKPGPGEFRRYQKKIGPGKTGAYREAGARASTEHPVVILHRRGLDLQAALRSRCGQVWQVEKTEGQAFAPALLFFLEALPWVADPSARPLPLRTDERAGCYL